MVEFLLQLVPEYFLSSLHNLGCIQSGDVENAELLFIHSQHEVEWDMSSWEYLVCLLCQALRLDKVLPIIGRLKTSKLSTQDDFSIGMAAMNVNLARAAAILCDIKTAKKASNSAIQYLNAELSKGNTVTDLKSESVGLAGRQTASGGKRAWKGTTSEEDGSRERSLLLFREHRQAEMRAELQQIDSFLTTLVPSKQSQSQLEEKVLPFFLRFFSFPSRIADQSSSILSEVEPPNHIEEKVQKGSKKSSKKNRKNKFPTLSSAVWAALDDRGKSAEDISSILDATVKKFGLPVVLQKAQSQSQLQDSGKNGQKDQKAYQESLIQQAHSLLRESFSIDGKWRGKVRETTLKARPRKLEVCSGAGEWVVEQVWIRFNFVVLL